MSHFGVINILKFEFIVHLINIQSILFKRHLYSSNGHNFKILKVYYNKYECHGNLSYLT
jgi:hypothetical protein